MGEDERSTLTCAICEETESREVELILVQARKRRQRQLLM